MRINKKDPKKVKKTVVGRNKKLGEGETPEVLNDQILKLKEEVAFLVDKDKFLKDEIAKKEDLIKRLDEEAPAELVDKKAELEAELKDLQVTIVQSQEVKENLEKEIKNLQTTYEENFNLTKNQIETAAKKVTAKGADLQAELEAKNKLVDDAVKRANDIIFQANKEKEAIDKEKTIALAEKNTAEKTVQDCEAEIAELEAIIEQESEKAVVLTNQNIELEKQIASYNEQLAYLKKEVSNTATQLKAAQAELDKTVKKIGYIQKKEESLKSFENYIIDTSEKYGLEYQPYEG